MHHAAALPFPSLRPKSTPGAEEWTRRPGESGRYFNRRDFAGRRTLSSAGRPIHYGQDTYRQNAKFAAAPVVSLVWTKMASLSTSPSASKAAPGSPATLIKPAGMVVVG